MSRAPDGLDGLVSTVDDLVRDLTPGDLEAPPPVALPARPPALRAVEPPRREPRPERRPRAPLTRSEKIAVTIGAILLVLVVEYVVLGALLGQG